jgi:hypothetical protein
MGNGNGTAAGAPAPTPRREASSDSSSDSWNVVNMGGVAGVTVINAPGGVGVVTGNATVVLNNGRERLVHVDRALAGDTLHVEVGTGRVRLRNIVADDTRNEQPRVVGELRFHSKRAARAAEGDRDPRWIRAREAEVDLEVLLPRTACAVLHSLTASFVVDGRFDDVHVETTSGNSVLEIAASAVKCYSVSGNITVRGEAARVEASSTSGEVSISMRGATRTRANVQTVRGDIVLQNCEGTAQTVAGDVRLDSCGTVAATSVSGHVLRR